MSAPEYMIVGRVRNAHGIRGEVVVESLTSEPDARFAVGRRLLGGTAKGELSPPDTPGPQALTIRRPHKTSASFRGSSGSFSPGFGM